MPNPIMLDFTKIYNNINSSDNLKRLCEEKIFSKKILEENHLKACLLNEEEYSRSWNDYNSVASIAINAARKSDNDIIFIKSFRNFPYIDDDLDILVRGSLNNYKKILSEYKFKRKKSWSDMREPLKSHYINSELRTVIHIHSQGSWNGIIAIDAEDVFYNYKIKDMGGFSVKIPNNDIEFLIQAAQFIFEDYYISLGSLNYIQQLISDGINWKNVIRLSEKQNWKAGLFLFIQFLKENYKLLGVNVVFPLKIQLFVTNESIKFPNYIRYNRLMNIYLDKMNTDLRNRKKKIPWQILIYFVITPIWKYWIPIYRINRLYGKI